MTTTIQSVTRALKILEVVATAEHPIRLSAISARENLHVSTAHRLLATLGASGFVEHDAHGHYRVGITAFRVGASFAEVVDLRGRIQPMLLELSTRTSETANLAVRAGHEAVYIDHVLGNKVSKLFTQIGQRVPLHCTAVGKALLASCAADERDRLLGSLALEAFTPHTITSVRRFRRALCEIRLRGYAVDREEHEVGVACVAAPVRDATGVGRAVLGISGPSARVLRALDQYVAAVCACAQAASRALGAVEAPGRGAATRAPGG